MVTFKKKKLVQSSTATEMDDHKAIWSLRQTSTKDVERGIIAKIHYSTSVAIVICFVSYETMGLKLENTNASYVDRST